METDHVSDDLRHLACLHRRIAPALIRLPEHASDFRFANPLLFQADSVLEDGVVALALMNRDGQREVLGRIVVLSHTAFLLVSERCDLFDSRVSVDNPTGNEIF